MMRSLPFAALALFVLLGLCSCGSTSTITGLVKSDWDQPRLDLVAAAKTAPTAAARLKKARAAGAKLKLLKETLVLDVPGKTYDFSGTVYKASLSKGSVKENGKPLVQIVANGITVRGLTVIGRKGWYHDGIHVGTGSGQMWNSRAIVGTRIIDCAWPQGEDSLTTGRGTRDLLLRGCLIYTEPVSHGSQHDKHLQINFGTEIVIDRCYLAGETANGIECKGRTEGVFRRSVMDWTRTGVQHSTVDDFRTLRTGRSVWDLSGLTMTGGMKEKVSVKGEMQR